MSIFTQEGSTGPLGYGQTSNDIAFANLVGSKFNTADGRIFALIQNGGTALAAGRLIQGPVTIGANHTALTTATAAIGATQITVTLGGTAVTANQYAGGFAVINAGTGAGQTLRIQNHPAQASGAGTLLLTLEDPLQVATSVADSKTTLQLAPFGSRFGTDFTTSGCVVCPITLTGPVLGVTPLPIPASTATVASYGFIQTKGVIGCLNDAGTAIGLDLMHSTNTPGAVMTYVAATSGRVGTSHVAGVTTEVRPITIQL